MIFDVLLPSVLFLTTVAALFLHFKYEKRAQSLFEEKKLRYHHAILLVAAMGVVATVLVFITGEALRVLFLCAYSLLLLLFTYLAVPKWYLAVLPPALFIVLYLYLSFSPYWIYFLNAFAIVFAIIVSVFLGSLFEWKTTVVFVALLTVMDVVQVLITGHMVESGKIMIEQFRLPAMIVVPTFPYVGGITALGLGDVFLAGLLSIQTAQKYGRKLGFASIIAIAAVFLILHTILLNYHIEAFPATVLIISGWLTALATRYLYQSSMLGRG